MDGSNLVVEWWWQLLHGLMKSGGKGHLGKKKKQRGRISKRQGNQKEQRQLDLMGHTTRHPSNAWGDALTKKHDNICRNGLLNPTGFTVQADSVKDNQLCEFMQKVEIDIMNFPEVNVCWHILTPRNQLDEQTMGWFESLHRSVAYNYWDGSSN
jgi:hypothetical protein